MTTTTTWQPMETAPQGDWIVAQYATTVPGEFPMPASVVRIIGDEAWDGVVTRPVRVFSRWARLPQ